MAGLSGNSFLKYSSERGIKQIDFQMDNLFRKSIDEYDIINHMYTLSEFHEKVMGYDNYVGHRLEDKRGRTVENFKVYLKKARRLYQTIKKKLEHNEFEKLLLLHGEKYIERAQRCIDVVYENEYLDLIKRSMDRNEICLGDTYFTNLRGKKDIEVNDLSNCFYDLIEIDGVDFISKLIKKEFILDYKALIKRFCKIEGLDCRSEKFIEALVSYPYEFMKTCVKYSKKGNEEDRDKYGLKLKKFIENDYVNLL